MPNITDLSSQDIIRTHKISQTNELGTRINTLQLLRFLAAFTVIITHSGFYISERLIPGFIFWSNGARGVDLFFVISGFVMIASTRSFVGTKWDWRRFFIHRCVRIIPLYWMVTTVKAIILTVTGAVALHAQFSIGTFLASILFFPQYNKDGNIEPLLGVGWSLNYEMFFYVIFSLALLLRVRPTIFVGLTLVFLSLLPNEGFTGIASAIFYTNSISLEFLLGMLIAEFGLTARRWPLWGGIGLSAGLISLYGSWAWADPLPRFITCGVPAMLVVLGAIHLEPLLGKRLPRSILYLGDASYALYLVHPLVAPGGPALLAKLGLIQPLVSIFLSLSLALVAGSVVHSLYDQKITKWLRGRLIERGLW